MVPASWRQQSYHEGSKQFGARDSGRSRSDGAEIGAGNVLDGRSGGIAVADRPDLKLSRSHMGRGRPDSRGDSGILQQSRRRTASGHCQIRRCLRWDLLHACKHPRLASATWKGPVSESDYACGWPRTVLQRHHGASIHYAARRRSRRVCNRSSMDYSFAVFGPQGAAPSVTYLQSIQTYVAAHPVLRLIRDEIHTLHHVLDLLAEHNRDIAALSQAYEYVTYFDQWLLEGKPQNIARTASSITALPRLCVIHVVQYFQFLEAHGVSHADFLAHVRETSGGLQGYCGGLPATVALASASDPQELAQNIVKAIRLGFAIGLYTELGDDSRAPGLAIMVVRVESEREAEDLVSRFPGTYISAFTDPRNISVVGPTLALEALKEYATSRGLLVQPLEIRGKVHNPENMDLAHELSALVARSDMLRLPMGAQLLCPARSNRTGDVIPADHNLSDDVLYTILASRSEWYRVLEGVAGRLAASDQKSHACISLGIGDFIPLMPFNKRGLRVTKTEWSGTEASQESLAYEYPEDSIAIVGSACRLPGASNLEELWQLISTGQDRHEEVAGKRFDMYGAFRAQQSGNFAKTRKWYGNFVDGVDCFDRAFFGINAREMANMDPQQRLLLELAYEALESHGYTKDHVRTRGDNVGCFIGASFTEYLENAYGHAPTAYTAPGTIRAFLCGRISYHFGWTGPSEVIDTACSASLVAVNRAVRAIQGGECPLAIAGGVNLISGVHNYLDLARAGFLSSTGQCKPWDTGADGYCRSDGVGLVVLKSLKQARADGDRIMAVLAGSATNQGGLSSSITNPDPVQQARLYREVLRQAAMVPELVTYVEAHGTGTQAGDKLETTSLREVFGSPTRTNLLTLGSVKGNIGHCETAAGIAGLLKVLSMLQYGHIPPQANFTTWNPKIPPLAPDRMAISTKLQAWDTPFRAAMVNSFGAAGSNATVLCCEAPTATAPGVLPSLAGSAARYPIFVSAESTASLKNFRITLSAYLARSLQGKRPPSIRSVAYTLNEKRRRHRHFVVFQARDVPELAQMLVDDEKTTIAEMPARKPVVLVLGGQSKQTIGLARSVYAEFTIFREQLHRCSDYLLSRGRPAILPAVFQTSENLTNVVALQTGHVAIQYAAASAWMAAGLEVDAVIGHSLGELAALAVSGRLTIEDALDLVAERASLMQELWGPEHGAMLAVFATRQVIHDALAQLADQGRYGLEVACYNSETSQVVSGDGASSAAFESILQTQQIKYVRVDTSHGFHSRLVDPILPRLERFSKTLSWARPKIAIEWCTANAAAPDAVYSPGTHARGPVHFVEAVRRLEARLGSAVWLEAGFGTPVMAMLRRALSEASRHELMAGSTKDFDPPADLIAHTVARLWKRNETVTDWRHLSAANQANAVWLPPYAFDRTSAWLEHIDRGTEAQRDAATHLPASNVSPSPREAQQLVLPLIESEEDRLRHVRRFRISVEGERFQTIVAGHAVRGRPLCPASVYLECATIALEHALGASALRSLHLAYEDLEIKAPIGLDLAREVEIVLHPLSAESRGSTRRFAVVSRSSAGTGPLIEHATGRLVLQSESVASRIEIMARLVEPSLHAVERSVQAEHLQAGRIYKLFSRVVEYGKVLQGISSMTVSGTQAIARVVRSHDSLAGSRESSVLDMCDAVSLDSFIQVVGLNMNTSDALGVKDVMICNKIDTTLVAKDMNLGHQSEYRVYTSYSRTENAQTVGDVFVWTGEGQVAAAFLGCRFVKLSIGRLERALDAANDGSGSTAQAKMVVPRLSKPVASASLDYSSNLQAEQETPRPVPMAAVAHAPQWNDAARILLETYTGMAVASMQDDMVLADLGVDSLAASEIVSTLPPSSDIPITGEDLLSMTVKELQSRLGSSVPDPPIEPMPKTKFASTLQAAPSKPMVTHTPTAIKVSETTEPGETPGGKISANKVLELILETTGIAAGDLSRSATLAEIGVDSLALTEILSALSDAYEVVDTEHISLDSRVQAVLGVVA